VKVGTPAERFGNDVSTTYATNQLLIFTRASLYSSSARHTPSSHRCLARASATCSLPPLDLATPSSSSSCCLVPTAALLHFSSAHFTLLSRRASPARSPVPRPTALAHALAPSARVSAPARSSLARSPLPLCPSTNTTCFLSHSTFHVRSNVRSSALTRSIAHSLVLSRLPARRLPIKTAPLSIGTTQTTQSDPKRQQNDCKTRAERMETYTNRIRHDDSQRI